MVAKLLKKAIPIALGYATGGPVGAATAAYTAESQENQASRVKKNIAREESRKEAEMAMDFGTGSSRPTFVDPYASQLIPNNGGGSNGGFFSTLRSGLRETGGFISDVFSSGLPQLFGVQRPSGVRQQPAITTVTNVGAQESQGSGSIQAGMGAALPSIISGARSLLKSPIGQLGFGTAVVGGASLIGPDGKKMRVTRKMKSQARMVVNLTGGNLAMAADILNISEDTLIAILLKRFRNDGPVVTKAAMRKTKQTIRRLHSMQDVLKSITPTAAGRRRAPMKRATTTTLIKN